MKKFFKSISIFEYLIWSISIIIIITCFIISKNNNYINLSGSLIGVTAVILISKGNPIGQLLVIIFSALYGISSYENKLYGEMITYLGMSAPIAIWALISWFKNPSNGNKNEVKVNNIKLKEWIFLTSLATAVTIGFYFILKALNTDQLIISTFSVTTSFFASYLTARRSKYYAIGYGINDVVLVIIWIVASIKNIKSLPLCINFIVFFALDIYGFINWSRMEKRQRKTELETIDNNSNIVTTLDTKEN